MTVTELLTELERRIARLEANRGASLRFCEVTAVDQAGHARVRLLDGEDMVSMPLRTLQRRTLKDKEQHLPDVGEHVACLFAGQGLEEGVLLGAMYSDKIPSPARNTPHGYYLYEDGTYFYYDREAHKYVAYVKGDIEVTCEKTVTVEAHEDIKASARRDVEVRAGRNMTLRAENRVLIQAGRRIVMRAPSITWR